MAASDTTNVAHLPSSGSKTMAYLASGCSAMMTGSSFSSDTMMPAQNGAERYGVGRPPRVWVHGARERAPMRDAPTRPVWRRLLIKMSFAMTSSFLTWSPVALAAESAARPKRLRRPARRTAAVMALHAVASAERMMDRSPLRACGGGRGYRGVYHGRSATHRWAAVSSRTRPAYLASGCRFCSVRIHRVSVIGFASLQGAHTRRWRRARGCARTSVVGGVVPRVPRVGRLSGRATR